MKKKKILKIFYNGSTLINTEVPLKKNEKVRLCFVNFKDYNKKFEKGLGNSDDFFITSKYFLF